MKLMTKAIEKKFKAQGRNEDIHTARVIAKFFTPDSNWTWYASEYDPETSVCFGFVQGFEGELGYFSLDELASAKGPMGLGIERDLYWNDKKTLAEVMGIPMPVSEETVAEALTIEGQTGQQMVPAEKKTETITDKHGNEVQSLF